LRSCGFGGWTDARLLDSAVGASTGQLKRCAAWSQGQLSSVWGCRRRVGWTGRPQDSQSLAKPAWSDRRMPVAARVPDQRAGAEMP
jgi:hypothetical protein